MAILGEMFQNWVERQTGLRRVAGLLIVIIAGVVLFVFQTEISDWVKSSTVPFVSLSVERLYDLVNAHPIAFWIAIYAFFPITLAIFDFYHVLTKPVFRVYGYSKWLSTRLVVENRGAEDVTSCKALVEDLIRIQFPYGAFMGAPKAITDFTEVQSTQFEWDKDSNPSEIGEVVISGGGKAEVVLGKLDFKTEKRDEPERFMLGKMVNNTNLLEGAYKLKLRLTGVYKGRRFSSRVFSGYFIIKSLTTPQIVIDPPVRGKLKRKHLVEAHERMTSLNKSQEFRPIIWRAARWRLRLWQLESRFRKGRSDERQKDGGKKGQSQ